MLCKAAHRARHDGSTGDPTRTAIICNCLKVRLGPAIGSETKDLAQNNRSERMQTG